MVARKAGNNAPKRPQATLQGRIQATLQATPVILTKPPLRVVDLDLGLDLDLDLKALAMS